MGGVGPLGSSRLVSSVGFSGGVGPLGAILKPRIYYTHIYTCQSKCSLYYLYVNAQPIKMDGYKPGYVCKIHYYSSF